VLDQAGAEQVQPALDRLLARSKEPPALAAAILGTGAIGGAGHLRALFELAAPPADAQRLHPAVERALEEATTALLVADARAFETLAASWTQMPAAFVPAVIRGVGATADGRGVELLGQILVWSPEHAPLAVAQLRRLGPSPDPEVNARIADELRSRLDPLDPAFCRAAILALAELGDFHSVPQLIDLLETAPAVEENALWALQRLTGRNWADSPDWWRSWYAAELAWREQAYPRLSRELREAVQRETLVVALREFGDHRLFRHDLALEVAELLDNRDRPVRLLAIDTLQQLGSKAALPALVELLADEDEFLRDAAWRVLQALTGETHPVDSPKWATLAAHP
jgi:HEAT repeat protein